MKQRIRTDTRLLVGLAGLALISGTALAQDAASGEATPPEKAAEPSDNVGGFDIPAAGEAVQSTKPKAEYITDKLYEDRLPDASMLGIFERELRKMKQSPPTPEELKLTAEQSEKIEELFAEHREALRVFNNESREELVNLRRAGGFEVRVDEKSGEDEDFSPMLYIDPKLIEPDKVKPDRPIVPKLTPEQAAAREELRLLLLMAPQTDELKAKVLPLLTEAQIAALEGKVAEIAAERLAAQKVQSRVMRTGYMEMSDLPKQMQERAETMTPSQREAMLQRYRLTVASGGPLKLKRHRDEVQKYIKKGFEDRTKAAEQKKLEKELQELEDEAGDDGDS